MKMLQRLIAVFLALGCIVGAESQKPADSATTQAAPQAATIRRYIVVNGDSMSGSWDSNDELTHKQLRAKFGDKFAWFRQGSQEYVVTDAGVMADLDKAMEPQKNVNRMQADVNSDQARVNALQAKVNDHQAQVNAMQQQVNHAQSLVQSNNGQSQVNADQTRVNAEQSRVNSEQARVNAEQEKVNGRQSKVNIEQRRVSAEFSLRMNEILSAALRDGLAKQLR